MKLPLAFALCAVLAALGVALFFTVAPRSSLRSSGPQAALPVSGEGTNRAPGGNEVPVSFTWQQIESQDYAQYVASLRRIGCPQPTVDDIVVADVNALYMQKASPVLKALRSELAAYYRAVTRARPKKAIVAHATAELGQFNQQRLALISRVLQHEVEAFKTSPVPWATEFERIVADRFTYLSPGKAKKVAELRQKLEDAVAAAIPGGKGLATKDMLWYDEARRSLERELSGLLSPEEFEQYVANETPEAVEVRKRLGSIPVSDSEFLRILGAKREMFQNYGDMALYLAPEQAATRVQAESQFGQQVQDILGTDRYAQYLKQNDLDFSDVEAFAQSSGLSSDVADGLYSVRKQLSSEFASVAAGQYSADVSGQMKADAVRRAEEALSSLLDDIARSAYLQSPAGKWLSTLESSGQLIGPTREASATGLLHGPRP